MKKSFFYGLLILLFIIFSINLDVSVIEFTKGLPNLFEFISYAVPPDGSVLSVGLLGILETLQIAFIGTLLGALISLPLAVLSSRNLFPNYIVVPVRVLLSIFRTLPSLLWAIIFVVMVGVGAFAGVLATMMYTIGYLGKLQYESIEGINKEPLEAVSSTGANSLQLIRFVVLPESANNLLSQLLFMFEYNVRSSTILGFVGAGGIGFLLVATYDF